jgi:hypothetical protein
MQHESVLEIVINNVEAIKIFLLRESYEKHKDQLPYYYDHPNLLPTGCYRRDLPPRYTSMTALYGTYARDLATQRPSLSY